MVGRGGRSKRCQTCRVRKIKCDEKKPRCSQCLKSCFDCEYPDIEFITEERPSPAARARPRPIEDGTNTTHILVPNRHTGLRTGTLSVPDDVYIGYLQSTLFVKSKSATSDSATWPGFLAELPTHPLATRCLTSLSQAYFGRQHGLRHISIRGIEMYGKSLHALNASLTEEKSTVSNDTLLAVMILSLYEMLVLNSTSGWIEHALGLGHMLQMRGPDSFPSPRELLLLESNRFIIILASLASSRPTFLSETVWKTSPWSSHSRSKDELGYLLDIFADIATLKAASSRYISCPDNGEVLEGIQVAIGDLQEWRADWNLLNIMDFREVPNETANDREILPSVFKFTSLRLANELCIYNAATIQALRVYKFSSTHLPLGYTALERQAAIEICKATDYHLTECPWMTAQFHLLFPLRMAYLALEGSDHPLRSWIQRRLTHFTTQRPGWGVALKLSSYGTA